MRNSAKYLLATAGLCLLTVGHPAADTKPIRMLDESLQVTTVLNSGIAQRSGLSFSAPMISWCSRKRPARSSESSTM